MGNVMETCRTSAVQVEPLGNRAAVHKTTSGADDNRGLQKGRLPGGKAGLKVKMVLTKAELEWLMLKLKEENSGGADVVAVKQALEEIQKERKRDGPREKIGRSWKPSLDRIIEYPETQSFNDESLDLDG